MQACRKLECPFKGGLRVKSLGLRVWGYGFGVKGLGSRVLREGLGFRSLIWRDLGMYSGL